MHTAILLLFALVTGVIAYLERRGEQERKAAIASLCAERGWTFTPAAHQWARQLGSDFLLFTRGRGRRCRNHIAVPSFGPGGRTAYLFDYTFTVGGGKHTAAYLIGAVLVRLPGPLPDLRISGEGVRSRLASSAGFRDVEVESVDFNRRFRVAADDRTHASDVLHPRMIEFLLAQPFEDWEIAGDMLLVHRHGHWRLHEYDAMLSHVHQFLALIPDYVWRKHEPTR